MRIGTVLRNDSVYDESPIKYAIYVGHSGDYYNMIYIYKDKVCYAKEPKKYVGMGKSIHPVGKTDVLSKAVLLIKNELLKYKEQFNRLESED